MPATQLDQLSKSATVVALSNSTSLKSSIRGEELAAEDGSGVNKTLRTGPHKILRMTVLQLGDETGGRCLKISGARVNRGRLLVTPLLAARHDGGVAQNGSHAAALKAE
ncbi:hypothetical protein NDU88_007986 [Pleurodeles waltl]|uniref:Uncharacterized protein n=1 Tax=Pleurodeles waltl TaxID=8319 RepID=A0AAV7NWH4_PLEWA|nr:hypothetical protein NDU88_007986 [Pleurodeles waltl]